MKRDLLSWWTRPHWIRHPGRRNRILFAGPWVGEFGWELLNWQGWVRALAPAYDRVIVCARESSGALYADVADSFLPHTLRGNPDHVILQDVQNPDEMDRIRSLITSDMDHLLPLRYVPAGAQSFVRFGEVLPEAESCSILIHARGKQGHAHRNWPAERWRAFCDTLLNRGFQVGAIGLSRDTLDLPEIQDFRDQNLQTTLNVIRSARVVVGPSSGPMHLASLCGTPHLVWTNRGIYRMGKTSREKYETWWNPLRTPVRVLEGASFDHPLDTVLQELDFLLNRPDAGSFSVQDGPAHKK